MWHYFPPEIPLRRALHGVKFEASCSHCRERTVHYEKEVADPRWALPPNFDPRFQRIVACGGCGIAYATDELDKHRSIGEHLEAFSQSADRYAHRAADAIDDGARRLFGWGPAKPAPMSPSAMRPMRTQEDEELDAILKNELGDLSSGKLADDDPLEKRFRELEAAERARTKK